MMYVLMFGGDPISLETLPPGEAEHALAGVDSWWRRYRRAGKILTGATLMPPFSATTVRFVGGRSVLHDGPFTPEPEAVGGFGIIEVADLDEALALARSWPAGGYVEIRPLVSPCSRAAVVGYPYHITQRGQDQ